MKPTDVIQVTLRNFGLPRTSVCCKYTFPKGKDQFSWVCEKGEFQGGYQISRFIQGKWWLAQNGLSGSFSVQLRFMAFSFQMFQENSRKSTEEHEETPLWAQCLHFRRKNHQEKRPHPSFLEGNPWIFGTKIPNCLGMSGMLKTITKKICFTDLVVKNSTKKTGSQAIGKFFPWSFWRKIPHHPPEGKEEKKNDSIGFLRGGCPRGGGNWGTVRIPFGKIGEP